MKYKIYIKKNNMNCIKNLWKKLFNNKEQKNNIIEDDYVKLETIKTITQDEVKSYNKQNLKRNVHVVPTKDGWNIKYEKSKTTISFHKTKKEAIVEAIKIAKNDQVELLIHRKDGKITEKNSYGNDPKNVKG